MYFTAQQTVATYMYKIFSSGFTGVSYRIESSFLEWNKHQEKNIKYAWQLILYNEYSFNDLFKS